MSYDVAYYQRDNHENRYKQAGMLRPDQYAAACYTLGLKFHDHDVDTPRNPGIITSIGCGEGVLEAFLERLGHTVVGVDDDLYDRLSVGHRVVKRHGSHLVLVRETTVA